MPCRKHNHPHALSLFWRIYLYALFLLVVLTIGGIAAFHITGDSHPWEETLCKSGLLVAEKVAKSQGDFTAIQDDLDTFAYLFDTSIALYTYAGEPLALSGPSPPPALSAKNIAKLNKRTYIGKGLLAFPLPEDKVENLYLLLRLDKERIHQRFSAVLIGVMVFLALLSCPLARFLVGPLEKIRDTARAIGNGDLSARTGIVRTDEVGVLAQTIDEMARQLEELIRSEKELLANISHELKTPLARMRVALELAHEDVNPDDIRSYLRGIEDDIDELEQLVSDVLTAARLDFSSGTGNGFEQFLHVETIDGGELIDQAKKRFVEIHPGRILKVEAGQELPQITGDFSLIRRALDNLLDNAVKYSSENDPITIHTRTNQTGSGIIIEISDQGIGIDDTDLQHIFEPFFRADKSRARQKGGAGLGLTLSKKIIEAHHGTISAAKNETGGLTFTVTLPVSRKDDPNNTDGN
ncbi:sensor histidine kinase [Thermodesulfobacteriota bacterium]